jgi:hypothetical protein
MLKSSDPQQPNHGSSSVEANPVLVQYGCARAIGAGTPWTFDLKYAEMH